ncbi:endonuclease/exonuclease/phosphatase family protein [Streptomyces sp. NPDC050617]|uniref:endonuclease/exonuclease/phosphatase family protein n=1 Tax=Streptomyces sp. NPDC050617 TaxID=3154628 RepID=UPI00341FFCC6
MKRPLTVLCWNFERNGGSDPDKRLKAHELLVSLNPHMVLRQEMPGADTKGNEIMYELEDVLRLRGWLGPRSCTAVFADPAVFQPVREWPDTGPMWVLPPTALTFRFLPAGYEALPLNALSYHLNYASPTLRRIEAEWLTTWADKWWALPDGRMVQLPVIAGGDNNSYPAARLEEDLTLPVPKEIKDKPHRAHRSYVAQYGTRLMHTRPDEVLRTAGMEDVARHWATTRLGDASALARTVDGCDTHGPDARIDRIYTAETLLPAVRGVDVIEVPHDKSDHHIVRLTLDPDTLSDILNSQIRTTMPHTAQDTTAA